MQQRPSLSAEGSLVVRHGYAGGSPPPPPGVPPPRPTGVAPQQRDDRSRAVRFDAEKSKRRSYSSDDMLNRRGEDDDQEPDDVAPPGQGAGCPQQANQGHHIQVAVRVRPLHHQEMATGARPIIKVIDSKAVLLEDPQITAADDYLRLNKSKERRYAFDEAFGERARTREVYERTARSLIGGVLQGFNATVFAYGATGAGKTHTMLGSPSEPGIMMLTLLDLFSEVANQKKDRHFEVKCSFLEVYNENIRDLLRPDADYLDIREDPVKGMCVAGISEVGSLENAKEIMALLHMGNKHRSTEATGANVVSSRSHAVLQVVVEQRDRTADIVAQVHLGKLSMIDLAGSERASHTNNKGMRMIEGANINRSLLALGNCITALSSAVAFVPYRDSKMTRLLKDSLGGNCRTSMIANVSPSHFNYEDTHNTLKYAKRASNIKTKAVRNIVRVNCHVSKYTEIIKELRGEISELRSRLAEASIASPPPGASTGSTYSLELESSPNGQVASGVDAQSAAKWKQELMQNFEERVRIKRHLIDLAHEAQGQQVEKSHAQVGISQWESERRVQDKSRQATPKNIKNLQDKLQSLKKEMVRSEETTHGLEKLLMENQRKAERLQAELPSRVENKDLRGFLVLVSRIHVMEVENMDMQEMNDVMAPLLHQKDLEAEALRLQIHMCDRMIEDQDELLMDECVDIGAKPAGWVEIPNKPAGLEDKCPPSSGDDHESPNRQRSCARRSISYSPASHGQNVVVLPPLPLTAGRGRSATADPPLPGAGMAPVQHAAPPPRTPPRDLPRPVLTSVPTMGGSDGRQSPGLLTPCGGTAESRAIGEEIRMTATEQQRAAEGGGRMRAQQQPQPAGAAALEQKRGRKKTRGKQNIVGRGSREKEHHQPVQLNIEASSLQKERNEDSQGSESERVMMLPGPSARGEGGPHASVNTAAERKGIIEKLNRKMKAL